MRGENMRQQTYIDHSYCSRKCWESCFDDHKGDCSWSVGVKYVERYRSLSAVSFLSRFSSNFVLSSCSYMFYI